MSGEEQQDDDSPHDDSVNAESLETIFGEEGHEPFHGEKRHDEGHDTTQDEHGDIVGGSP